MYLNTEQPPGYVLGKIRSPVELVELSSLCQTLFSAPLLRLQVGTGGTLPDLVMWKCDRTQIKGFLNLLGGEEILNTDQPHPC